MQERNSEKMKHQSFVLPSEERQAFRHLCVTWNLTPSEALRAMVRMALGGGYNRSEVTKGGAR